ncbi:Inner membrane protein YhaH [Candidatus Izimaplasma bacterium HR1]|jgi:uncharacterized membrane protein YhaH (DUF805 family)|uniref:DUF805 domain-containing protein n=1 Tax=Candidatus Izimoplasma sp. HR1 TaxID=1541959 RepID=UPI0004F64065|nr:Inner membrane protein YhaH [Candidatus Izimaplasma bacterium HR1]
MDEITKEYVLMWKNWNVFEGRSNVREYWMAILINWILVLIVGAIGGVIPLFRLIDAMYGIAVIVPSVALFVRRMHDIGKSGWNLLWIIIPLFGWIYLIYLLIQPSK